MKRFPVNHKLRGTAALTALLLSSSLTAGQIDSVCKTDDQTLNGIKSDPDQTLWVFMQTVCQGQFVITKSPVRPQPSVISPAAAEVTTLNSEVSVIPLGKVDSPAQSTQSTVGIDAINSQAKSVTARIETESMTKHNSLEVGTQPRETNEPTVSLAKKERNPEQNFAVLNVVRGKHAS